MKKLGVKLLFVLSVFALSACNSTRNATGNGEVEGAVEASTHNISVTADEAVNVAVPTSATSGTKVDMTLTYDSEEYHVSGVSVNTMTPSKTSEKAYSFVMPDEDVSITVTGNYTDPSHGKYAINNANEEKGVVLVGIEKYAAAGQTVSFTVEMNPTSAYSFTGDLAITTGENETLESVSFTLVNNVYSFTMPSMSVNITADVEEKEFLITIPSTESSYISYSSIKTSKIVDDKEVLTSLDYKYSSSQYILFVKAGTVLRVPLKNTSANVTTALKVIDVFGNTTVIDELVTISSTNYAYFTMPTSNVTLETVKAPNYKSVSVVAPEHLDVTLKLKDGDNYVDVIDNDHFIPDSTVYVFVSSNSGDDYGMDTITVTYSTSSKATVTTVDAANGIYSFEMVNYDNVTVTVTEKNLSAFKNYVFAGKNYFGANLYSIGAKTASTSTSYSVFIDGSGAVTKGSSKYTLVSATSLTGDGIGTLSTGKNFCYSDNMIFGHYSFNQTIDNSFGKDYIVAVRTVDDSDIYSNYSFEYQVGTDKKFIAVEAYRTVGGEKTYVASLFFDALNKEFYGTGLSFNFHEGSTTIASTSSTYDVVVNGTTVGTVNGTTYTKA